VARPREGNCSCIRRGSTQANHKQASSAAPSLGAVSPRHAFQLSGLLSNFRPPHTFFVTRGPLPPPLPRQHHTPLGRRLRRRYRLRSPAGSARAHPVMLAEFRRPPAPAHLKLRRVRRRQPRPEAPRAQVPRRPDLIVDQHPAGWHSRGQSVQVFYIAHGDPSESYRTAASISDEGPAARVRGAKYHTTMKTVRICNRPAASGRLRQDRRPRPRSGTA
jgi:hypothetical protein